MVCVTPAFAAWWEVRDCTERAAAEKGRRSLHGLVTSVLSTGLWNCLLFLLSFLSTRFTHCSGTFDTVSCHAGGPVIFSVGFVNLGFIIYFEAGFSVLETIFIFLVNWTFWHYEATLFFINSVFAWIFALSPSLSAAPLRFGSAWLLSVFLPLCLLGLDVALENGELLDLKKNPFCLSCSLTSV